MKKRKGPPKIATELQEAAEAAEKAGGMSNFVSVGGSMHTGACVITTKGVKGGNMSKDAQGVFNLVPEDLEPLDGGILGKGASGAVRKLIHKPSGKKIALKEIKLTSDHHLDEIGKEMATLYKFAQGSVGQAGKATKISPYLIEFYGAYVQEGAAYIALELMDGSLADMMNPDAGNPLEKGVPEPVLAPVMKMVLKGIDYLHKKRHLVHRDLKPGNLLFAKDGTCKVTDFGVSQQLESTKGDAGSFVGTVTYMSPERLTGEKYNYSADIWALGITLAEMAMGTHPFDALIKASAGQGTEAKFWKLVQHLTGGDGPVIEFPDSLNLSKDFHDFVGKCLIKDKAKRPCTKELLGHPWLVNNTGDEEENDMAEEQDKSTIASWLEERMAVKKAQDDAGEGPGISQDDLQNVLDGLVDIG